MEILSLDQLTEWTNVEEGVDIATLTMLESAAIDHCEFLTNAKIRPFKLIDGSIVTPIVPAAILHALALYVSASYDNRVALDPGSLTAVERLCAPFRVHTL